MFYSYVRFSSYDLGFLRIGGPGLGNLLFPWARYIVGSKQYGLVKITPTWPQLKLGPILRHEKDKRFYWGLFNHGSGEVKGFKKYFLLSSLEQVPEENLYTGSLAGAKRDRVIIFEGMNRLFADIYNHHKLVKDSILKITKDKHNIATKNDFIKTITVHVRLSDYSPELRIPVHWYVNVIHRLRELLDRDVPVLLFSDGTNDELNSIISLNNVHRISFGTSIADLLAMSHANILVTSASTFSMWASYLGRMPTIWCKGRLLQKLYEGFDYASSEIEIDEEGEFPKEFKHVLNERF